MKVEINLKGNKVVIKESSNIVDAKEVKSVAYTKGDITTFAKPVREFRGYTLKVTVTAAKPSIVKTAEDALRISDKFGLKEWDIL